MKIVKLPNKSSAKSSTSTKSKTKRPLNASQLKSYELLKDYPGPNQQTKETWRTLVKDNLEIKPETVENHIVRLVGEGKLKKEPYISSLKHFDEITTYLKENPEVVLLKEKRKGIKEQSGYEPTYLELKIAIELLGN